jgi:BASS family bile acid:Na+ symporter
MGVISPTETLFLKSQHRLLQPRNYSYALAFHSTRRVANFPRNSFSSLGSCSVDFPLRSNPISQNSKSIHPWRRYVSESDSNELYHKKVSSIMETLKQAYSFIPHGILLSTILALVYPPSFTWFKPRFGSTYLLI